MLKIFISRLLQIYKDFKSLKVTGKKCACIIILLTETVLLSRSSTLG